MSVPRYWREEKPRYRLVGEECTKCGERFYPKTPVCTCGSTEFKLYKLAEAGKVVSWTVIRNAPVGYEKYTPYVVALIELDDGVRILSQLVDVDPESVKAGMRVEYTFRKVTEDGQAGLLQYGYKFRPIVD
jgi:uncharacterized OB-fold protein